MSGAGGGSVDRPLPFAAVIVNWNGGEQLLRCVESLLASQPVPAEIVVVDNQSDDGSADSVERHDGVQVIHAGANLGFGGGANRGARATRSPLLVFLNPDVRFESGALAALAGALERPRAGIVGPEVRNVDGTIQNRGIAIDPTGHPVSAVGEDVFFVAGCALGVRRDLFEQLDGFDDEFFLFAEDLDLCWRAQLLGRDVRSVRSAVAFHDGGSSIPGGYLTTGPFSTNAMRLYLRERNTLAAVLANYEAPRAVLVAAVRVAMAVAEAGVFAVRGRLDASAAYFRAMSWVLRHAPSIAAKRRLVQRTRVIGDRELTGVVRRLVKLDVVRTSGIPSIDSHLIERSEQ